RTHSPIAALRFSEGLLDGAHNELCGLSEEAAPHPPPPRTDRPPISEPVKCLRMITNLQRHPSSSHPGRPSDPAASQPPSAMGSQRPRPRRIRQPSFTKGL